MTSQTRPMTGRIKAGDVCTHGQTYNCDLCEATGALEAKLSAALDELAETRAENERLRQRLVRIQGHVDAIRDHGCRCGYGPCGCGEKMMEIAEEALAEEACSGCGDWTTWRDESGRCFKCMSAALQPQTRGEG